MTTPVGRTVRHADGSMSVELDIEIDTTALAAALERVAEFAQQWTVTTRRPGLR